MGGVSPAVEVRVVFPSSREIFFVGRGYRYIRSEKILRAVGDRVAFELVMIDMLLF